MEDRETARIRKYGESKMTLEDRETARIRKYGESKMTLEDREMARIRKYGESKMTQIMMATVPHVTSGLGLRKF